MKTNLSEFKSLGEKEEEKKTELEHGETCQIEVLLAELSELLTPDLAPRRVRIQEQLTEVGRRRVSRFSY